MKALSAKAPPLTHAELRALRREDHSISTICGMAYRRNGLSKDEVREIVFGERA